MNRLGTMVLVTLTLATACKSSKSGDKPKTPETPVAGKATDGGTAAPAAPKASGLAGAGGQAVPQAAAPSKSAIVGEASALAAREGKTADTKITPALPENALALIGDAPVEDKGDFKLVIEPGADTPLRQAVAQRLSGLADGLNKAVKLPRDIPIVMKACGQVNAFYNPKDQQIEICDEFAPAAAEKFARYKKDPAEVERATLNALEAAFLHEMGHALIAQWHLPAVGREEDAVDQLAAVILINESDDSNQIVLDFAEYWLAAELSRGTGPFWDEHSLDEQRFYNLECLVFGSNPDKQAHLVTDLDLPLLRAARCPDEYKSIKAAWGELLRRFLKAE